MLHERSICRDIQGPHADLTKYNASISACAKGRHWQRTLGLFEVMGEQGIQADAITYYAFLSALARSRRWHSASIGPFLGVHVVGLPRERAKWTFLSIFRYSFSIWGLNLTFCGFLTTFFTGSWLGENSGAPRQCSGVKPDIMKGRKLGCENPV